jgi:tetratricopeptide (TPR) repeat protein
MQSTSKAQTLTEAKSLADRGLVEQAWNLVEELMLEEPGDGLTVMMGAYIMHRAKRLAMAYYLARQAVSLSPGHVQTWMECGHAAKQVWQLDESKDCFRKALTITTDPEIKAINYSNIASIVIESGRFREAEPICRKALEHNPGHAKAMANLAMCQLARGDWSGWKNYSKCLDTPYRQRRKLGKEPDWNGEKGKRVFAYTEQGLGDEINFASMFPDLIRDSERVVIECEPKLTGLFARSFKAKVYGTRRQSNRDSWDEVDRHPDFSIIAGELGQFYRTKNEDFPGGQYLTADPSRRIMWRALFDSKKKPVIGLAWTGGIYSTGKKLRRVSLEQLLPLLRSIDAHWVSLQYQDAEEEISAFRKAHGVDLVQYPWATLTPDYDDTAALVSECDQVICMQTCVGHLAGALGKEAWMFIPERGLWRYGETGDKTIWYKSMTLFREHNGWTRPIERMIHGLRAKYAISEAA